MTFAEVLPTWNACLNATSAILLLSARRAIARRNVDVHRRLMLAAFATSTLFLVFYVLRWSLTGTHVFVGPSWLRAVYLAILSSHMLLAIATVPLALRSLYLGLKRIDAKHRGIVRFTYPIWLYVSVTGVVVYVMLYHVSGR